MLVNSPSFPSLSHCSYASVSAGLPTTAMGVGHVTRTLSAYSLFHAAQAVSPIFLCDRRPLTVDSGGALLLLVLNATMLLVLNIIK